MNKQRRVLIVLLTVSTAFWALQAFAAAATTDRSNGIFKGSITTKNGYELQIDARIDTAFPNALSEVKLGSGNETDDRMERFSASTKSMLSNKCKHLSEIFPHAL